MNTSKIVIGSLSVLGSCAIGTLTTYLCTMESVWSMGPRDFLPTNASPEDWNLLHMQLKSSKENDWSEELIKIKSQEDWTELKDWCANKYKENFNHIFKSPEWKELGNAKRVCVLKVENKLKSSNKNLFEGEWSKDVQMEKNITELKENSTDLKITNKLIRIKTNTDLDKTKWELWHWCKSIYNKGFQGTNSNIYKLVNRFCIKNT